MSHWLEKNALKLFLLILPLKWRSQVESRPGFNAVFHSVFHLVSEKGIRLVLGVFTYALVVRHLGPEQYGRYSWILNFITIFLPLIQYGLDEIVTRDIVNAGQDTLQLRRVIWGALIVRGINAIIGSAAMIAAAFYLRPDDLALVLMVVFYSLAYVLRVLETVDLLFQARLDVRRLASARNYAYLVSSGFKFIGVMAKQLVGFFVFVSGLEYFLGRVFVFWSYKEDVKELKPIADVSYIKELYKESFPQFLTIALFMLNDRLAILALGQYSNNQSVGVFNAAAGLLEIWSFIPLALAASLFPPIIKAQGRDETLYQSRSQHFFDLMLWLGIGLAIILTLFGNVAVTLLFGKKFEQAIPVLKVLAWSQPFFFFHMARMKWFTLERRLSTLTLIAVLTIILNMYCLYRWVPKEGALGASWALIFALVLSPLALQVFSKKIKQHNQIFYKSLSAPIRLLKNQL